MKTLSKKEIECVNGGDLNCPKTALSTASAICVGIGSALQAWGQSIHVAAPNLGDATQTAKQRVIGMTISIGGLVLNCFSFALAALSSAEQSCDFTTNTTVTNSTIPTNSTTTP
jgi:hypothetical protein